MKTLFKKLTAISTVVALLIICAQTVLANGSLVSLNATNFLDAGAGGAHTNISSWPTNGAATVQLGVLTGIAVPIFNQEHCVFVVQGMLSNSTAATMGITLVTACTSGNAPSVLVNGSGLIYQNDFVTTGYQFNVAIPASTNWFHWETNIIGDSTTGTGALSMPNADFIGISLITNNFAANQYLTTLTVTNFYTNNGSIMWGINKKLIPTPLIGQ